MGVEFEVLDPGECKRRHPLISTDNLLGALWDPLDGDNDPAQLCQALARRARKAGAEVYRFTDVTNLTENLDGTWIVHTNKGDIACESIVNAEAIAMAVSCSGALACELHVPNEQVKLAYQRLTEAGEPFGMKPFGSHASESMRLEKGYRHWKADLITEFNPFESGLGRFVRMEKDFVGKAGLEAMTANGPRQKFISLTLEETSAPAHPGGSIIQDGNAVGTVSSADWGHRIGQNIALGFIKADASEVGLGVQVLNTVIPAKVQAM